ncbi:hypothetical protein FACS1894176_03880 [Bacteroidia bacterium]|nr:hypothetical protein FACS1894176_03880 [Bacteroidia bacterium]
MMGADIVVTTVADEVANAEYGTEVIPGSFRDAVDKAQSGDVIKFNAPDGNTIALKGTIGFSGAGKVLVVDGINAATGNPIIITKSDEAKLTDRAINIANGSGSNDINITLKNLSFENIVSQANGACISSGNSAYQTLGPIVNVTLESCQFKNNEGRIPVGSSSGGGGVYMVSHGTNLVIKNCLFVGNKQTFTDSEADSRSVAYGGGVISSTGNNTSKLVVINSTFADNSSKSRGGSIFIGSSADLINCTFVGNSASQGGGFYFHNNNPINIFNCIFTNNHSKLADYEAQADLSRNNGTFTISHSLIGATNVPDVTSFPNTVLYQAGQPLFVAYETSSYGISVPVLANNGGLFPTAALVADGLASGTGTASVAGFDIPTTDQRGATRLTPPSIGAYEYGGVLTNIQEVQTSTAAVTISVAAGQIVIAAENQGIARVYSLSGAQVAQTAVNGVATVALPKGVYIVKFVETAGSASGIAKVLLN